MADPKSSNSSSVVHNGKHKHHHPHHKETHGLRDDIDVNTPVGDVKAPNVFERAKEEIEAIVEAIHPKKESKIHDSQLHGDTKMNSSAKDGMKSEKLELHSGKAAEKAKEHHHKESHDDESGVKAPNVFERAKEEIEAIFDTIHHKK